MRTARTSLTLSILLAAAVLPAGASAQQRIAVPERPRLLEGRPAEVFRIGAEEGESWELLSNVEAVAFDADDNLYVLDAGNYRVLVFDRTGKFVRQIGKQGQGPGEITFARAMIVDANGDVVVYDWGRGGYTVFGPDGEYKRTITGAEDQRILGGSNMQAAPGGGVITRVQTMLRGPGQGGRFAPPTGPVKTPIVRVPLAGDAEPETLFEIEQPPPKIVEQSGGRNERRVMVSMAPPLFSPPVVWGVLPTGGIAINDSDAYAVRVLDRTGRVERVFSTGQQPRQVTNRDREAAREERRERMRNPSGGGIAVRSTNGQMSFSFGGAAELTDAQIEEQVKNLEFAETIPLVRGLLTEASGRIWVQRTNVDNPLEDGAIDLLRHDGAYLGSVQGIDLPAAVSRNGLAAWITRDEMDVEQVVVRRLPADWR